MIYWFFVLFVALILWFFFYPVKPKKFFINKLSDTRKYFNWLGQDFVSGSVLNIKHKKTEKSINVTYAISENGKVVFLLNFYFSKGFKVDIDNIRQNLVQLYTENTLLVDKNNSRAEISPIHDSKDAASIVEIIFSAMGFLPNDDYILTIHGNLAKRVYSYQDVRKG